MLNMILFGPPGSGKGTQSSRIACRYNLVHLSTGEMFRQEVRRGSGYGEELASYMNKGHLVPDQLVIRKLYRAALANMKGPGLVFDGFPRTLHQARILDQLMTRFETQVHIVICLMVEEDELFSRMMGRAEDSGREDDNTHTMRRRLEIYHQQTKPLKEYYRQQKKISFVSGMAPVKDVSARIAKVVEYYRQKKEILQSLTEDEIS